MQIDFLSVFITVASLIVLALPGFLLAKGKMLPEKATEACSTLVLYGCQPALVFMSFQKAEFSAQLGINMLIVAGLAFVIHFVMIGIVMLAIPNKNKDARLNCVRYACVFSNCGYIGLPFLQTLFAGGTALGEILVYAAVVISVFNILCWTVGTYMITGDVKNMSLKKIIINPTIIGIVLGFIVFMIFKKPIVQLAVEGTTAYMILVKFTNSLNFLGDMVTPLAMIVIGIRLANVNFKQLLMDKWAYLVSALKLVLMSLVTMLIVSFLPVNSAIKYTMFFLLSMPCATNTALFAVKFGGDGDSASVYVLLTTVLSILTIPLLYLVMSGVFGVVI